MLSESIVSINSLLPLMYSLLWVNFYCCPCQNPCQTLLFYLEILLQFVCLVTSSCIGKVVCHLVEYLCPFFRQFIRDFTYREEMFCRRCLCHAFHVVSESFQHFTNLPVVEDTKFYRTFLLDSIVMPRKGRFRNFWSNFYGSWMKFT